MDGDNVVDNGFDKSVVTDRVIYDNTARYSMEEINLMLLDALGYPQIATLSELQGDVLGHAGDMMAFIDANVIALGQLPPFAQRRAIRQINAAFHGAVRIVSIPNQYRQPLEDHVNWHGVPSACGLYVNLVLTEEFIFMPQYGASVSSDPEGAGGNETAHRSIAEAMRSMDNRVRSVISQNSQRTIIPVRIPEGICRIGASLRRLTWQVSGHLADRLIWLARKH